ncbi:hypothetical protein QUF75_08470 [Desulfococcaceae bacterium HSG7]|nr:hypothetical protein [Desulfococcaceae bacterium HSG7]
MKLAGIKHGLLINFNVRLLKQGLKSFILSIMLNFMSFMIFMVK